MNPSLLLWVRSLVISYTRALNTIRSPLTHHSPLSQHWVSSFTFGTLLKHERISIQLTCSSKENFIHNVFIDAGCIRPLNLENLAVLFGLRFETRWHSAERESKQRSLVRLHSTLITFITFVNTHPSSLPYLLECVSKLRAIWREFIFLNTHTLCNQLLKSASHLLAAACA